MTNPKMLSAKILLLLLISLLFESCAPITPRKAGRQLDEYEQMTAYIMSKNYHQDFEKPVYFYQSDIANTDSILYRFMKKKRIINICVNGGGKSVISGISKDSVIRYKFISIPFIGIQRELDFDFSSAKYEKGLQPPDDAITVLKQGIYLWRARVNGCF